MENRSTQTWLEYEAAREEERRRLDHRMPALLQREHEQWLKYLGRYANPMSPRLARFWAAQGR